MIDDKMFDAEAVAKAATEVMSAYKALDEARRIADEADVARCAAGDRLDKARAEFTKACGSAVDRTVLDEAWPAPRWYPIVETP